VSDTRDDGALLADITTRPSVVVSGDCANAGSAMRNVATAMNRPIIVVAD